MVFVDRQPGFLDADTVTTDDRKAAHAAVRHLGAVGHRRIAYLGAALTIGTARDRLQGFTDAMVELGAEPRPRDIRPDLVTTEEAERAALEVLREPDPPTAIFSGQNYFTVGAIKALRTLDLHHQIAIIGFDDLGFAELVDPPVSVVAHDPADLGRSAAELLFRRLDGDKSPTQHLVCPFELIARGSGEIPPPA
jgi:LacI family transcriptional regulator